MSSSEYRLSNLDESPLNLAPVAAFLRDSLQQLQSCFINKQADFSDCLRQGLSEIRLSLPPNDNLQPFLLSNCQAIKKLNEANLNRTLVANGLSTAKFMVEPPSSFDCVLVPVEAESFTSGYVFFWDANLNPADVYFLLGHAWGHLALGQLRQGDNFSHWDVLSDLQQSSGPSRRWDKAVQAQLSLWLKPLLDETFPNKTEIELAPIEWKLPGWKEGFERLRQNDLDDSIWSILLAAHHYTNQLLKLDFGVLDEAVLFPHQRRGAVELAGRLRRLGVAMLADSVGLGKTRTTGTLIRLLIQNGLIQRAVILTPQKLEHNWQAELTQLNLQVCYIGEKKPHHVALLNKDKFKRLEPNHARAIVKDYDLLVIEEAHQDLRNFSNKFHRNLSQAARDKYGLLVTATPWNNRRGDIFTMLYPFVVSAPFTDRPAQTWGCFAMSFKDGLRQFESNTEIFQQIYALTTLQRTRRQLRESGETSVFYAPRRPYLVGVPYTTEQSQIFASLLDKIQQLRLPHINFMRYLSGDSAENYLSGFQRFGLLKRAESSMYAFGNSLQAMSQKAIAFLKELQQLSEDTEVVRQWLRQRLKLEEETTKEEIEESFNRETNPEINRPNPNTLRAAKLLEKVEDENRLLAVKHLLLHDCAHDLQIIRSLEQEFNSLLQDDPKLKIILEQVNKAIANQQKIVCISQYADTAWAVYTYLLRQPLLKQRGVGLVTGGKRNGANLIQINGEFTNREAVLSRFAPNSWANAEQRRAIENSSTTKLPTEIAILVGSDTLSVGQNLQDARVLLNLDLCWNPMQHEQRIGRIDRPRHSNDSSPLDIYYFLNLELIESELKLQATIEHRLTSTYQDTEFDDEILPGYFEMIEQFRRLRHEQASDKAVVAEANIILEDITERSARPPQSLVANSEVEREALLQLQSFASESDLDVLLPKIITRQPVVTLGQIVLQDRHGLLRSELPQMALAAELEFSYQNNQNQVVGESFYRHCYITCHQVENVGDANEGIQLNLEDELIAPFIDGLFSENTTRQLNNAQSALLQIMLSRLQDYALTQLDYQRSILKKARRLRQFEPEAALQAALVTVRLVNLKCLLL